VAVILALEPDHRQAAILKRVVSQDVRATLDVVDSRDAAMAALTARVPDVILLTALLSPRDEEDLIAHLRTLEGVEHVQTHTIPMLAGPAPDEAAAGSGLFGRLRRKKEPEAMAGCDPSTFGEEIRSYLARAAELKAEAVATAESLAAWAAPAVVDTPRTDAQIW
jgi:hypothetical protein